MARNKHPEETVQKILDVSLRLFQEKGYDHTTIQGITDALGMSKGAIYHHFRSKEEILDRINDRFYDEIGWFRDIRDDAGLSGLEKLRQILNLHFSDARKRQLDSATFSKSRDPRLVAAILDTSVRHGAPFFRQLVDEGIRDGSIAVSQPKEFSEALLLLLNMWVGMFTEGCEDFAEKMRFMREFTERMGLDLFSDAMMETARAYYDAVMSGMQNQK